MARRDFKKGKNDDTRTDLVVEKLISVNRVSKSTKGGRTISFAAMMVVGDKNGNVGFALGKANDVTEAIKKATQKAKRNLKNVKLKRISVASADSLNVTIPHEVIGKYKSATVLLRPASPGTGVIAGGGVRAVCDAVGITDVLGKSLGASNKCNVIKATICGLVSLMDAKSLSSLRGLSLSEFWG